MNNIFFGTPFYPEYKAWHDEYKESKTTHTPFPRYFHFRSVYKKNGQDVLFKKSISMPQPSDIIFNENLQSCISEVMLLI